MIYERLRVFVSSKMGELAAERAAVKAELDALKVDAWVFEEDAGARPVSIREAYLAEVEAADLYVGIFWRGFGEFTIDEFEHAGRLGKDRLVYEKRTDIEGQRDPRLQAFLDRVSQVETGLTIRWFDSAEELGEMIKQDAARWQAGIVRRYRSSSTRRATPSAAETVHTKLLVLLRKVKSFWIEGVLEHSIHGASLLELGKETSPDAIEHPWEAILELPFQGSSVVAPHQRIDQIFDEVERSLLILGQPGSGKTTTLLELARTLVRRAETKAAEPIPVVFHLSTYDETSRPLIDLLADELSAKYQIPRRLGLDWLEQNRLLLLLDGLDEVAAERRAACVEAINEFVQQFGLPGLVVCSRLQEYTELPVRLKLNGAINLQPLTLDQVDAYVAEGGSHFSALAEVLQRYEPLRQLAKSPLMLSIMGLAYQDTAPEDLHGEQLSSQEGCRKHLFDTYIERMFQRRGKTEPRYSREQVILRLSWLARQMASHNKSLFLLEDLQPTWLANAGQRAVHLFVVCIGLGISSAVAGGAFWLGLGGVSGDAGKLVQAGLFWQLLLHLPLWFLAIGILDSVLPDLTRLAPRRQWGQVVQAGLKTLIYLGLWLVSGLPLTVWFGPYSETGSLLFIASLLNGTLAALIMGAAGRHDRVTRDIHTVEAVGLSWSRVGQASLWGWLGGACLWVPFYLAWDKPEVCFVWQPKNDQCQGYLFFLIALSTIGALSGVILGALAPRVVEGKTRPNEGMRLSLRNAWQVGSATGLVIALTVFGLFLLKRPDEMRTWVEGARLAAGCGAMALYGFGLWYGGLDALKHYTLRLMLSATGQAPHDFPDFLDHCARLNFIQRAGGGYLFVHRLLLDHFAILVLRNSRPR